MITVQNVNKKEAYLHSAVLKAHIKSISSSTESNTKRRKPKELVGLQKDKLSVYFEWAKSRKRLLDRLWYELTLVEK